MGAYELLNIVNIQLLLNKPWNLEPLILKIGLQFNQVFPKSHKKPNPKVLF
jgi:hypothetical protein